MKSDPKNTKQSSKGNQSEKLGKTDVEGQNPKQNDSPDHDEHRDENRVNQYNQEYAGDKKNS